MKPILIANLFRKEQEHLHLLESAIQNLIKIRTPSDFSQSIKLYKEYMEKIILFAENIDTAYNLDNAPPEIQEKVNSCDKVWQKVFENRKILENLSTALKELKYNSDLLIETKKMANIENK